jgi:GNAT superfamily N-acetyltransferase
MGCIKPMLNKDRSLNIRGFQEGDLRLIYDISLRGFDGNYLYSEIPFEVFKKLYQPILPMLDRELVVIAEVDGVPVGFMFAFIVSDMQILKSMAVLPEFRGRSIGAKLINHVLIAGQRKGAQSAIAALMSEGNNSTNIVSKYGGGKIREYTLYCLEV